MTDLKDLPIIASKEEYSKKFNRDYHGRDAHLIVNKAMIRNLGVEAAIFLSDLISKEQYFEVKGMLDDDGYFFNSEENREEDTGLSPYKQSKAIEILVKNEILLSVVRKGLPPKQRFKINHLKLKEFIDSQILKILGINSKIFGDLYNTNELQSNDLNKVTNVTLNGSEEPSPEKPSNRFQRSTAIPDPIPDPPKSETEDYIKPKTGEYAVVSAWNKLSPPACEHAKLNTKVILHVSRYLEQMRNGVFGDPSRRKWDGKWMDRHKIDMKEFAERKWTFREICRTIEGPLGDMYKEGFWPQEKTNLPRSLSDALYNPRTQTSFFVMAYYDPPGSLKSQPMKDPHKGITEDLVAVWHAIDPRAMGPGDWKQYSQGIKGIEKYLGEIDWSNYGARQMFPGGQKGNPYTLVMEYVRWMKGQSPDLLMPSKVVERLNWSMIRPDYWMWQKFMEAVNTYWGQVFDSIRLEG